MQLRRFLNCFTYQVRAKPEDVNMSPIALLTKTTIYVASYSGICLRAERY